MGDYADMAIDSQIDDWRGGDLRGSRRATLKTCRRCGLGGLFWQQTEDGWRLHDLEPGDSIFSEPIEHVCPTSGATK